MKSTGDSANSYLFDCVALLAAVALQVAAAISLVQEQGQSGSNGGGNSSPESADRHGAARF